MSKDIGVDVSRARSNAVGDEHGITPRELKVLEPRVSEAHKALRQERRDGTYGFFDLYKDRAMLKEIKQHAKAFKSRRHNNLVVLGIGGSALGLTTLVTALKPAYYNLLTNDERHGHPRVFVMDNVDPDSFAQMMALCPPEETMYNIISKSGSTAETVSQALIVLDALEKAVGASKLKQHAVITTGPPSRKKGPSPLQVLKRTYRLPSLTVPPSVGGRFSVFSAVGLFPAALLGIDIDGLLAGCRAMDRRTSKASLRENPAYLRAAFHYLGCEEKDKTVAVMMPYSDRLREVADWYRQLWAESLGKKESLDGRHKNLFTGQTPVKALGVTDQHSQLQLYLEGPNDKIITVLEEKTFKQRMPIPRGPAGVQGVGYLRGKTMNRLIESECRATVDALRDAQRPVIRVTLPTVNANTVGQLLYMLEVETAMAGRLFNVNAFDQPAVEAIKVFTRRYMRSRR